MAPKLITIVTINYNDRSGAKKTIDSIKPQLSELIGWVVIDGGSLDGSVEVIEANSDVIDYWVSEKDEGIYDAMNKGAALCESEFIWFVNSGDYLLPGALNEVIEFILENRDVKIIVGGGYVLYSDTLNWYRAPRSGYMGSYHSIPALHQSTIYKTAKFPDLGYPKRYSICGDHWLAAYYFTKVEGGIGLISNPISVHPIHGGAAISNIKSVFSQSWKIQRELYNSNIFNCVISAVRRARSMFFAKLLSQKLIASNVLTKRFLDYRQAKKR